MNPKKCPECNGEGGEMRLLQSIHDCDVDYFYCKSCEGTGLRQPFRFFVLYPVRYWLSYLVAKVTK